MTINAPHLILDGAIDGSVLAGPYQRQPATAPVAGLLVVGNQAGADLAVPNYRTGSIVFDERSVLDDLIAAGFDPLTDELPPEAAGPVASIDADTVRPVRRASSATNAAPVSPAPTRHP